MAVTFKGQPCQWGTDTEVGGGVVVNDNLKSSLQRGSHENKDGARIGVIVFDETYAGSLDIVLTTGNPPQNGEILSVYGKRLLVVDTEKKGQHQGKRMYSVTLDGGANLQL